MSKTIDDPRPALTKLNNDQQDIIDAVLDGFHSRREIVEWCHSAIIATLGELDDDLFEDVCLSRSWLSMLIDDRDRRAYWSPGDSCPGDGTALAFRRLFVAREVEPSTRRAFRRLRFEANEYVDDGFESPDPDEQTNPGMRPSLTQLESRQARELRRVLDGYADVDDLLEKLVRMYRATYAEHSPTIVSDLIDESHTREYLLASSTSREATEFREAFAVRAILPAFNRAARKLAPRSAELAEHKNEGLEAKKL